MGEYVGVKGFAIQEWGRGIRGFLDGECGFGGSVDGHFVEEGCTQPIFRLSGTNRIEAHS